MAADGVLAYPGLFGKVMPGQVNGVRTDLVCFLYTVSDRAHNCQFSLPERHSATAGPAGSPVGLVAVPQTKNTVCVRMSDALGRMGASAHATGRAFRTSGQGSGRGSP